MGRKSLGNIRRKEIVKAFYAIAKEIGLENTSIAKVARKMNISNGLVMHYFKTKDELLKGLNEFILEQHLNIVASKEYGSMDSEKKLRHFIETLFSRKWNKYFDDGVFYSCYALIYRNEDFNKSFKDYLESLHGVLRQKLHEAHAHGLILNKNIDEVTEVIFALVDGAYYYLGTFQQSGPDYDKQVAIYIKYTTQLLSFNDTTVLLSSEEKLQ